jgi:hypothetical protein
MLGGLGRPRVALRRRERRRGERQRPSELLDLGQDEAGVVQRQEGAARIDRLMHGSRLAALALRAWRGAFGRTMANVIRVDYIDWV